jgi:hypothetical protein
MHSVYINDAFKSNKLNSMKFFKPILLVLLSLSTFFCFSQKGIGTNTPIAAAILELKSTSKGFLLPRLTIVQRDAMTAVEGLVIYCINCVPQGMQVFNGIVWIGSGAAVNTGNISDASGLVYREVTSPNTGKIWLDRNLGATRAATNINDANAFGHYYQWGRATDGHQLLQSTINTNTATSGNPNSNQFIAGVAGNPIDYNWTNYANEDALWQGGINDNTPCPSGYRLPTETEFQNEINNFTTNNTNGAYTSFLRIPIAGRKNVAGTYFVNNVALWTSTTNGVFARFISINPTVSITNSRRAFGCSVRCIKE